MRLNRTAIVFLAIGALALVSPRPLDAQAPAGATARCKDGTYSFSKSRSGTCSQHGGVAQWLGGAVPAASGSPQQVTADLRAFLVYSGKEGLSPNIIDNPNITLWNTVIGEGGSGGPSEQTLVTVTVGGVPDSLPTNASVHLVARVGDRVQLDRSVEIGVPNAQHQYIAAFLLYDTGCAPVTLTVSLPGLATGTLTKEIPFACGE